MNWVSLVGLYQAAPHLPDGGYLATHTAVGVIIVGLVMQAQLNLFNGTRNFGAILPLVCSQTHSRSSTERPRKLTCRHFRSVGIAGNAR